MADSIHLIQHNDILTRGKEQKAEGARHRRKKEVEVAPSTTKKAPEEASKPPINTIAMTATKEATKDGALKPPSISQRRLSKERDQSLLKVPP